MLYDPEGKRRVLTTDKPFTKKNSMPSWVNDMPKESEALKAKREALEKAQIALDAEKDKQDKKDITNASTEGAGENASEGGPSFLSKVKDAVTGKSDNVTTL